MQEKVCELPIKDPVFNLVIINLVVIFARSQMFLYSWAYFRMLESIEILHTHPHEYIKCEISHRIQNG
jgi:hypothetical protein